MRNRSAVVLSATGILLALILPYPSAAQTMFPPQTNTTQPKTTTTSPTLTQQPAIQPAPIEGMGVGSALISVRDSFGNHVSAATVDVLVNGQYQNAKTDAGGMASFGNLPPGSYSFSARKEGYRENQATANVKGGMQAIVSIAIPKRTGGLAVTVKSGTTLLAGAVVEVWILWYDGPIAGSLIQSATTNSQGVATFSNLQIGNYSIHVSKTGFLGNKSDSKVGISENQTTNAVYEMIPQGPPRY